MHQGHTERGRKRERASPSSCRLAGSLAPPTGGAWEGGAGSQMVSKRISGVMSLPRTQCVSLKDNLFKNHNRCVIMMMIIFGGTGV
jgi:hypothetical protein